MAIIKSFVSAISLYSKLPMPNLEYKEGEDRFSLCFFPFIGVIICGLILLCNRLSIILNLGNDTIKIIILLIPIALTGGIHLDGFLDVMDAIHSYGDKGKKLKILDDPHIGAFSIIKLLELVLIWMICMLEIDCKYFFLIGLGFIISRALSGIALLNFVPAKDSGMLMFTRTHASKKVCNSILFLWVLAVAFLSLFIYKTIAIFPIAVELMAFVFYRYKSNKEFGGITGDLAGCFLVMAETGWVVSIFIAGLFL